MLREINVIHTHDFIFYARNDPFHPFRLSRNVISESPRALYPRRTILLKVSRHAAKLWKECTHVYLSMNYKIMLRQTMTRRTISVRRTIDDTFGWWNSWSSIPGKRFDRNSTSRQSIWTTKNIKKKNVSRKTPRKINVPFFDRLSQWILNILDFDRFTDDGIEIMVQYCFYF